MRPTALAIALTCALAAPATARAQAAPEPVAAPACATLEGQARAACEATVAANGTRAAIAALDAGLGVNDTPAADTPPACVAFADATERARCEALETEPATPAAAGVATTGADTASADAAAQPSAADAPAQAEQDFAALYGAGEPYDPVADPTLPPEAVRTASYDPWERWNRRAHRVNDAIDRRVAKPLAQAYMAVVPRPLRLGVSNFFNNLGQPVSALNSLLQGRPKLAGQTAGRFLLNSTLGIGGLFDPATDAKLPNGTEDFGQTLGVWGWKTSRYVELPVFGPRTVRDIVGLAGDSPLSPMRQVQADRIRVPLQGLQLVDLRTRLMSTDALREGVEDDYALVRDAWLQRRNYQIFGDRMDGDDAALPDYLREDTTPVIPVDAMPVIPGG